MSLEVRFDGTLIDEQYYTGLTNNNELFNESFVLGTTPCNQYKLKIAKEGVNAQPSSITLSDGISTFANLEIDNIEEEDYEYVYTLTDKMINLNFYYDASEIFIGGSTTLLSIALDICAKAGLTLGTNDFRGYNKSINWYDNRRTARDYIGYIAELNGGFARIEGNVLYFIKQNSSSVKTIDIDDCENYNIGEYHQITRVVFEQGSLKYEYGNESGNTLYLNGDNVFITEESEVEAIYNDIQGFEFYSFTTSNCPIDYDVKAGDIITFTDGISNYPTIAQYDLEFFGDWIGGYNLSVNTEKQEETKLIGNKENIKNLRITVDRQNNVISQVVENVGEQNNKISQITQSVDEINQKIQDIADITVERESYQARVEFENINESEPIAITIQPTSENISYLYPSTGLFPSATLYPKVRTLRFIRIYEEEGQTLTENIDYILPDDLLYYDSEHFDEFYLNYDSQMCQVIKRCKYNADGTVGLLANEVTTDYPYPEIALGDGDYEVKLLGYNSAYLKVRLMAANIYTTQFATKVEVRSEIQQTANEINLKVEEKLDEEDFTGANIVLAVNNDSSSATINADKISLARKRNKFNKWKYYYNI